jgi:hypothetical protein
MSIISEPTYPREDALMAKSVQFYSVPRTEQEIRERSEMIKAARKLDHKDNVQRERYEMALLNICVEYEKRGEHITKAEAEKIFRSLQNGTSYAATRGV